jgi:hypothetical protein
MKVTVRHRCADAASYRAARVKSLFNVEDGSSFDLEADLPIDGLDWKIGAVVGPSGSGKSSMASPPRCDTILFGRRYRRGCTERAKPGPRRR